MSAEFGVTAWGRDWVRLAQPTTVRRPQPALPRARSLARNNRVGGLELAPGRIRASVEDDTHQVTITVPQWDQDQLDRASRLSADAGAGDLPDELHATLVAAGLAPGPDPDSLHGQCSCRSRVRPCPHLLAVYFDVARRLDEQPRNALLLRGLPDPGPAATAARIPLSRLDVTDFYRTPPRL